jgi:hypothetical protein
MAACLAAAAASPAAAVVGKELSSTLSFLLQLSFRRVWQPYPLAQLSAQEQDIAAHMAQLGLVHVFNQVGGVRAAAVASGAACLQLVTPSHVVTPTYLYHVVTAGVHRAASSSTAV